MNLHRGYVAQAQEEGAGLVGLAKTLGCGVAHLCSNAAYQVEHANAQQLVHHLTPRQVWEGATASIRQAWTSGNKAEAAGRALWIGLSTIAATKGLSRAGEASGATKAADIAAHVDVSTARSTALFWTGMDEIEAAKIARSMGGTTLEDLNRTRGFSMPKWDPNDANVREAWYMLSGRYAAGASGTVRVIVGPRAWTVCGTSLSFRP